MFMASCAGRAVPLPLPGQQHQEPRPVPARVRVAGAVEGPEHRARARSCRLSSTTSRSSCAPTRASSSSRYSPARSAASIAAGFLKTVGGAWVLRVGASCSSAATLAAFRIPRAKRVRRRPRRRNSAASSTRRAIVVAGTAMGLLRGAVGFMTFFFALPAEEAARGGVGVRPRTGVERGRKRCGRDARPAAAPPAPRRVDPQRRARSLPAVLLVFAAR